MNIISASRRTDIPAFFSDKFIKHIQDGYIDIYDTYSREKKRVSLKPDDVSCIVFWTKNPAPLMDKLHLLKDYNYYFQYTITAFGGTRYELNVPTPFESKETLKHLHDMIGKDRIIWRFDPIICNDEPIDHTKESVRDGTDAAHWLLLSGMFEYLAYNIGHLVRHCVTSVYDPYAKCKGNIIHDPSVLHSLLDDIVYEAEHYNVKLFSCAEELHKYGIQPTPCIDPVLIKEVFGIDVLNIKDKTQRRDCLCVPSIDIGSYRTCKHKCIYCYAQ